MKNIVNSYVKKFTEEHRKSRRAVALLLALAMVVATGVTWQLHSTGVALTNETYCGLEEHTHSADCYESVLTCGLEESEGHTHTEDCYKTETTLVCGKEESEGHTHDESCYDEDGNLICGKEESKGHTHDDSCYETETTLVCGKEESEGHTHTDACYEEQLVCGKEEHTHTVDCLTDETADVETASDWEATLPDLTGDWATDLVAVAQSQLGYTESTANFTLADDGATRKGYTRYGAWYGNEYGDWDAMFVSFCLYYAGIPEESVPQAAGAYAWTATLSGFDCYTTDGDYTPAAGDIAFFDADGDGAADGVGIVSNVSGANMTVVQGDSGDQVAQKVYAISEAAAFVDMTTAAEAAGTAEAEEADAEAEEADESEVEAETYTLTYEGEDYIVTATYGADAALPENVELIATEYAKDSENYLERYAESAALYGWDEEEDYTDSVRLFNIGFYDGDGLEVEPAAAVQVTITYLNQETESGSFTVTHFAEDGTETIETETEYADGEQTITFGMDSFSDIQVTAEGDNAPGGSERPGEGGFDPGGSSDQECDPAYYNKDSYVFYDTFNATTDADGDVTSGSVNTTARNYIDSVTLNSISVVQRDSSRTDWSTTGASQLSSYFPNAYYTSENNYYEQTVTLTITPKTGYYVTAVVVACTSQGSTTPYGCNTWSEGNAFQESFSVGTNGSVEISITSTDFSHKSESPYYFILIAVAPIPSPLYVEYDYGSIVDYIGKDGNSSAFSTSTGWTTTSTSGNYYGDGISDTNDDSSYTNGNYTGYGVMTDDTQYKYAYTSSGTDTAASWKHYANTITTDAKEQAAAAGYVFVGWKAEYYTTVTVSANSDKDTSGYQGNYNNWDYTWSDSYGSTSTYYSENEQVTLTTNVRLIAQWVPIGITLTKTVSGLPDTTTSNTYNFTVYYRANDSSEWTEYTTSSISVTGNGTGSTVIYPAKSGQYMVTETNGEDLTISGTTYYITVNDDGTVTVGAPPTSWTTQTVGDDTVAIVDSLAVTNTYTETAPTTTVILKKISSTSTGTDEVTLSGAVFTLTDSDGNTVKETLTTGTDGTVTISDLSVNTTYTLNETTAPSGYNLLTDSITFEVSSTGVVTVKSGTDVASVSTSTDGSTTVYTITVENEPGTVLPSTGGSGTWLYTLTGLTLCGAALVLWKRRETD